MKGEKVLIFMLVTAGLLLQGCSCKTWTTFWGGDTEKECADHWHWKKKAAPEPAKVAVERPCAAPNPCAAPAIARQMQSYPVCDTKGNAIRLEKMTPVEVVANEPFDYRIKVTNLTDSELQNVIVTDHVPANLMFKSSVPEMKKTEAGDVHWMLGTLKPKASEMISVSAVAEGTGLLTSCAEVSYDSPICAKINIVKPQLSLAKFAPSESLMCDRIPLRYVVSNTGSGYACNITIKDQLHEGLMTSDGGSEVMFTVESLGPGKSHEFKTMVDAHKSGSYQSKATATSTASGMAESNMTTTVVSQPVLAIAESGPASLYIGRSFTYEISVTNKGQAIARDTVIEASIPDELRFESASLGGSFSRSSPGKVVWNIGTLEANASKTVTMTFAADKAGTIKTSAMAKAYCAETVSASAQTVLSGIPGILLEVIDVADPIEVGQNETYVITVTNQGSAPDTNIQIKCTLEENMQYVSSSGSTVASVVGNEITFARLDSLAPKAQAKWMVNVKAMGEGDMRFKAVMSSDQFIRPVEETEATTFYK